MKVAITGSTGGIGNVICDILEKNNIDVVKLEIDLSNDFDIELSELDGLIYSAGVNYISEYQDISFDNFEKLININSLSFLRLCQKLKFNHGANIIAVGSLFTQLQLSHTE